MKNLFCKGVTTGNSMENSNRPNTSLTSPSAPTQTSSQSITGTTNHQATIAAAVTSNLAESIDTVADHFSPAHQPASLSTLASQQQNQRVVGVVRPLNQPPPSTATIASLSETPGTLVIGQPQGHQDIVINSKEVEEVELVEQQQQLMNITTSLSDKNTLFGLEMPFDVVSAGYAALVATGGIIGYVKAGSIPSLAAGLTFGGILGIGAYMTSVNPNNYYLTLATSSALGGLMGYRFINSGKFMPAGLIAILSIGMITKIGYQYLTSSSSVPTHVKE